MRGGGGGDAGERGARGNVPGGVAARARGSGVFVYGSGDGGEAGNDV